MRDTDDNDDEMILKNQEKSKAIIPFNSNIKCTHETSPKKKREREKKQEQKQIM